ncbi:centromere protein S isoform X2 [Haemorhous mexicanus]|uniref:centromere protein S isoform X2 n=1 Tax=Haemorhous mexicanus TaxID=30427 RepID=UPI0028BF221C|nr:centromere protein S isoform X2 [Haemorhous mexicanus]
MESGRQHRNLHKVPGSSLSEIWELCGTNAGHSDAASRGGRASPHGPRGGPDMAAAPPRPARRAGSARAGDREGSDGGGRRRAAAADAHTEAEGGGSLHSRVPVPGGGGGQGRAVQQAEHRGHLGDHLPAVRHAKRTTVTTEDVKLLARRSNSLLKYITQKSEELASSNMEQKEKKKKKSSAAKGERTPGEQEAAVTENEDSNMA